MLAVKPKSPKPFSYSRKTVERASRSLVCSPFQVKLLETMRLESVPLTAIATGVGVENGYTKHPISELAAENTLLWLIQVGVLRREVDGQGITDSFRLTPLGSQIVEKYQGQAPRTPSWLDRFYNALNRWFRLPF